MPTRINIANRIVMAIAIRVQAIDGFGIQVGGVIGRDESAPFGAVIPGVAVVQAGIIVVVVAAADIFIVHFVFCAVKKQCFVL
jgi:hypothetical protein